MTSNNRKSNTSVLYVLSGFLILLIIDILYDVITDPTYLYLAIILILLYIYTGIGIIKQWPSSRNILLVLTILYFVGTITSIIAIFFMEEGSLSTSTRTLTRAILGLAISPVMFFYLRKEKVKSYFKPAP